MKVSILFLLLGVCSFASSARLGRSKSMKSDVNGNKIASDSENSNIHKDKGNIIKPALVKPSEELDLLQVS